MSTINRTWKRASEPEGYRAAGGAASSIRKRRTAAPSKCRKFYLAPGHRSGAQGSAGSLIAELGIGRELTGKKRNRVFSYDRYLAILSEVTEAL